MDPQESENFEKRNEYYYNKLHGSEDHSHGGHSHSHSHGGHSHSHGLPKELGGDSEPQGHTCDPSYKTKFFIPEKELTFKEKALFEMTKKWRIKKDVPNYSPPSKNINHYLIVLNVLKLKKI